MANVLELHLTRKRDGSVIPIAFERITNKINAAHFRISFQGVRCEITNTAQGPALYFSSYNMKQGAAVVGAAFGFVWDRKSNINILIESTAPVDAAAAAWAEQCAAAKAERETLEAAQPKILVAWDFLDWGDYRITQERRIIELRAALPGETEGWRHYREIARLDDSRIGDLADAWKNMVSSGEKVAMLGINSEVVTIVTITPEQAAPFISQLALYRAAEEKKKAEVAVRDAAIAAAQKERQDNIAAGAVYFHCESKPHNEDLSGVILNSPAPNGGLFTLEHRITEELFARIRRHGNYFDADFLEDCDMFTASPGWRFSIAAVNEIARTYRVFVDGKMYTNES